MKKLIAMFLLVPSLVLANPLKSDLEVATMQTICLDIKSLTELLNEFEEIPYVRGQSRSITNDGPSLSLVIFVNPKSGSFTIVERADKDSYCLLAVGNRFEPVPKETQDKLIEEHKKGRL